VAALVDAIPELGALYRALSVAPANDVTGLENDAGTPRRWASLRASNAAFSEVVDVVSGAEGDRTPDLMTASPAGRCGTTQEGIEMAPADAPGGSRVHDGPPDPAGVGQVSGRLGGVVARALVGPTGRLLDVRRYRFGELEFSWDERKAAQNARRHGVRFEEATTAFIDPLGRVYDDPDHSETEARPPADAARADRVRSRCVKNTSSSTGA
jgi:hypothetical protein